MRIHIDVAGAAPDLLVTSRAELIPQQQSPALWFYVLLMCVILHAQHV